MNKLTKILVVFLLVFNFCLLQCDSVSAVENTSNELSTSNFITYDKEGDLVSMSMPEDYSEMSSYHSITTLLSSGYKSWYDNGYHPSTSVWRRVDHYYFNTSSTVNVGVSFTITYGTVSGTLAVSNTTSTNFGYSISVDQNRDSKVRVYTDFNWKYYRADVYDNYTGEYQYTYYFSTIQITAERFVPVYR